MNSCKNQLTSPCYTATDHMEFISNDVGCDLLGRDLLVFPFRIQTVVDKIINAACNSDRLVKRYSGNDL